MTRRLPLLLALIGTVLLLAAPAVAQTPSQVADWVSDYGYWIDPGLDVDEERISDAVARAGNAGLRLAVVLLEDEPSGGAVTFAGAVVDDLGDGWVLVIAAETVGMDGWDFDATRINQAVNAGLATNGSDEDIVDAVVASLIVSGGGSAVTTSAAPTTAAAGEGGGGSKTGLIVILVLVGGLVLLVVWAVRRQSKSAAASKARAIEEARKEIKAQLDAMANTILEISDNVSVSDSREDNQYLEQASRAFTEASESYEGAADLAKLEEISDRLDEARWQLDAAGALADGKPAPPRPTPQERHACFFDPTHSGPFEEAEVRTAAGSKKVRVCAADAEKLRRGEQPDPRMIEVNGRRIPAPSAPRSYGGGGFSWLDVFAVIVGGMATSRSYDWGSRPSSGGWGSGSRGGSGTRWGSGSGGSAGASTPRARIRVRAGGTRIRRR